MSREKKTENTVLTIIVGNDEYERKNRVDALIEKHFSEAQRAQGVSRYTAQDLTDSVIASFRTLSFFVEKQAAIISGCERFRKKEMSLLAQYIAHPSAHTMLILEGDMFDDSSEEGQAIAAKATMVMVRRSSYDMQRTVVEEMRRHQRTIDPDAATVLAERCGGSSAFLRRAIEKVVNATPAGATITEQDVATIVESFQMYDGYKLADALCEKNATRALEILDFLIEDGTTEIELLGIIGWTMRRFYEAHYLLHEGEGSQQMMAELRIPPRYQEQFLRHVNHFTRRELARVLETLYTIDAHAKQGISNPRTQLELFFVALCKNQFVQG